MANQPKDPTSDDRFYNSNTLLKWFAISSIVMLLFTVWMVLDDFGREWKGFQREFMQLQGKKTQQWIEEAKGNVDAAAVDELNKQMAQLQEGLEKQEDQIEKSKNELVKLTTQQKIAVNNYQAAKGVWDVRRYEHEAKYGHAIIEGHADEHKEDADRSLANLDKEGAKVAELSDKANAATALVEAKEKEVDGFYLALEEKKKEMGKTRGEVDRLEKNLDESKLTVRKVVRSSPILDLADPVFKIKQIVLPHIKQDIEFAKMEYVDRCTTCHLSIDTPGYENEANPFKTHPKLDVILGSRSPHPIGNIGCTICHGGRGRAVDFVRSAHTPRNEEQKKEWEQKYHWHEMHHVPEKMLPLQYTEGSCTVCHKNTEYTPKAENLTRSIQLVRSAGCYGCHRVEGWDHIRKSGPSLKKIGGKLNKDWLLKWVRNPKSFNERSRMPQVFHLSNMETTDDKRFQEAEIFALVDYIQKLSEGYEGNLRLPLGNAERGKELFSSVGCLGCHQIDDYRLEGRTKYGQAPDLSTVGSKVTKDWLAPWLRNPRHYWEGTQMPDLRLSDSEISDLMAYLLNKKNAEFESASAGQTTVQDQRDILHQYLMRDPKLAPATVTKVDEVLAGMKDEQVVEELGKKAMARVGCYGCHEIKGWESVQGIGTELSDWGGKLVKQLDFGLHHVEHSRRAFAELKLKDPRIYDKGMVKTYLDKLRMPQYDFNDEEREKILLFLLGRTGQKVSPPAERVLNDREQKAENAYRLIHKYNCQGCHVVEDLFTPIPEDHPDFENHEKMRYELEGRVLAHYSEDITLGPPNIKGEGAKVISSWLYSFLQNPVPLRRSLKIRMPSFHFPNEELNTIVEGWANEGGVEFPYVKNQKVVLSASQLNAARTLFQRLQCNSCHTTGEVLSPAQYAEGSKGLAPDLLLAHKRLHRNWIANWLRDPQKIQPGTRMPGFWPDGQSPAPDILNGDSEAQINLLADYLIYMGQSREAR